MKNYAAINLHGDIFISFIKRSLPGPISVKLPIIVGGSIAFVCYKACIVFDPE